MKIILILQPSLPSYRYDFFARLALACPHTSFFVVYSGSSFPPSCFNCPPNLFLVNKNTISLPLGLKIQPLSVLKIITCDLLVIGSDVHYLSSYFFFLVRILFHKPTYVWGHFLSGRPLNVFSALRLSFLRFSSAILFYASNEVKLYRNFCPQYSGPIVSLNNGLNFAQISSLRQSYSHTRPPSILFIGRYTPKSSLDLLIQAMSRVNTPNVSLHIVGVRSCELHLNLASQSNLYFHGPLLDESKIAAIANQCLISVYPGDVGLSIMHSLAYGLPSILHSSINFHMPEAEIFCPNLMGAEFTRGDLKSLSASIDSLLSDPFLLKKSNECIKASRFYNTEVMASNLLTVLGPGF